MNNSQEEVLGHLQIIHTWLTVSNGGLRILESEYEKTAQWLESAIDMIKALQEENGQLKEENRDATRALFQTFDPVPPIRKKVRYFTTQACGACLSQFPTGMKPDFCPSCGKPVKWGKEGVV